MREDGAFMKDVGGLTVTGAPMAGRESALVGLWVKGGSRYERESVGGMAHLLEHMAFKGTQGRDAAAIAREVEDVGGEINAATDRETVMYYVRVLRRDVGLAVDLLGDMALRSRFAEDELALERDVVEQEIGRALDTPEDVVMEGLARAGWGGALGRSVLGTKQSVRGIDREDLLGYVGERYRRGSMCLAAAGGVEEGELEDLALKWFAEAPGGEGLAGEAGRWKGGAEGKRDEGLEQAHVALGLRGVGKGDDAIYAQGLFAHVLGGGTTSRLFQEAREKRGLCYEIGSWSWSFMDTGMTAIHGGCAPGKAGELSRVMLEETQRLASEGPTSEELERARAGARAGLVMRMESPSGRAGRLASDWLLEGKLRPMGESLRKLEAVGIEEVRDFGCWALGGKRATSYVGGKEAEEAGRVLGGL